MTWLARRFEHAARARAARVTRRVGRHLPADARVLDVGSGTGHNAALWLERGLRVRTTDVVDFHVTGPPPVPCDATSLPFGDRAFDVATVLYVLHYARDPARLLAECLRVADRVVVLQSTFAGPAGRAYLTVRELLTGRAAFRCARRVGFVPHAPCSMSRPQLVARDALARIVDAAGARRVDGSRPPRAPVARELLVLERRA